MFDTATWTGHPSTEGSGANVQASTGYTRNGVVSHALVLACVIHVVRGTWQGGGLITPWWIHVTWSRPQSRLSLNEASVFGMGMRPGPLRWHPQTLGPWRHGVSTLCRP